MISGNDRAIYALVTSVLGERNGKRVLNCLTIEEALLNERGNQVSRAAFAMAMNVALFHDLLDRVPSGADYVRDVAAQNRRVTFDHGALRTVRFAEGPTGGLPAGQDAFARIFIPLGYEVAAIYPLDRLGMTGRAYRHIDAPEAIPQFFLSELHVDRFDPAFGEVAWRVFGTSRDPLDNKAKALLDDYAAGRPVNLETATEVLPTILAAFDRQHEPAAFEDYELLRSRSNEAAWIATEGNAFNHATDRVPDVAALASRLKSENRPMKEKLEISASGRVRQTAFRADSVQRPFADGIFRTVPGSFYEFISRDTDPETGMLDLSFDSGNATGIFTMTRGA